MTFLQLNSRIICLSMLVAAIIAAGTAFAQDKTVRIYVGTYTDGKSKGIYTSRLNLETGELTPAELAAEVKNPSFLAIHPNGQHVYAVSEVADAGRTPTGAVVALAVEPKTGMLKRLNAQSSQGAGPCHLVVDQAGKNVLVANYGGGSCAVLPIGADGKLGEATAAIQHVGKSVNPGRQEGPHAHSINLDPVNRFAFVADLGLDKILIYRFDPGKGTLTANDPPSAAVVPGAGPRHFAFHPTGKFAYVINEMASTVTAFRYDAARGSLQELQTISTLPDGYKESTSTAEVVVHPSGKFLYGSNRGHDSLAVFTIDPATGRLTAAGHQPTGGKTPRNFAIDPAGKWLMAENQGSGTIVVMQIDATTGGLSPNGVMLDVPSPVCVRMMPAGK